MVAAIIRGMATTATEGPRERVVQAAARLLRTRGYTGTSLRDIVKAADAPWGSLQHYFPGGKDQIVVEAMTAGTSQVDAMIDDAFIRGRGAEAAVRAFFVNAAEAVEKRDFDAGCPVALVALEYAGGEDEIARLSRASIDGWIERFATYLRRRRHRVPRREAPRGRDHHPVRGRADPLPHRP